jgi:hypothetical protein
MLSRPCAHLCHPTAEETERGNRIGASPQQLASPIPFAKKKHFAPIGIESRMENPNTGDPNTEITAGDETKRARSAMECEHCYHYLRTQAKIDSKKCQGAQYSRTTTPAPKSLLLVRTTLVGVRGGHCTGFARRPLPQKTWGTQEVCTNHIS